MNYIHITPSISAIREMESDQSVTYPDMEIEYANVEAAGSEPIQLIKDYWADDDFGPI